MSHHERSSVASLPARARWREWLVMLAFLAFLSGYATLYFRTPLADFTGSPPRYKLLGILAMLPEQYVPNWFGHPPGIALFDRLPMLAWASAILSIAGLLGWVLLRLARLHRGLSRLERLVFSLGIGANVLSLYVLSVGLMGALDRYIFVPPAAGVLASAGAYWVLDWRRAKNRAALTAAKTAPLGSQGPLGPGGLSHDWLWLGAPFVLAIVLGGMLPPTDFDVREYHLQAPKEFYLAGQIRFLPHNVYGNMPLGSEMLSLLAMVLAGDWWQGALIGKTIIAAFAPLTALALLAAGTRFGSRTAGVVAALAYISVPWISHVSSAGLIEGVSAFYLWTAVYAVLLWRQAAGARQAVGARQIDTGPLDDGKGSAADPGVGPVALAGFLAGAAVSCKYPAALFVALPLAAWVWLAGWRPNWKATVVFLVACAAGCAPWFIKNWVLTGNPTYPLLYEVFQGATRTDMKNMQWLRAHLPQDFSIAQLGESLAQVGWRSAWISPILLPLAALAWLARPRHRTVVALLAVFAYVVAAWWLCTHRIDRFLIPALPLVALLAGLGATWSSGVAWRRVLLGTLVCGLAVNWLFVVSISGPAGYNAYFVQLQQLRYDTQRADYWHVYLNNKVPKGCQVLAVGDAQVFDLEMPVLYNTVFDDSVFEKFFKGRTPAEIHSMLIRHRISHVYVHWGEIKRYRRPGNYGFSLFVKRKLFDDLVDAGVFDQPMHRQFDHGEVYPVKGIEAIDGRSASLPESPTAIVPAMHER